MRDFLKRASRIDLIRLLCEFGFDMHALAFG